MKLNYKDYLDLGTNSNYVNNYLESGSTTANLKAFGISKLVGNSSGANSNKYTIDAPITGVEKVLVAGAVAGTSDGPIVYTGSTAITIQGAGSAGNLFASLDTSYACCTLIGLSTSLWQLKGASGTVTLSTST